MNSVLFWNCASGLFNKKPFIEKYIESHGPVLFFISECEISPGQMLELMNIKGYSIEIAKTYESRQKGRILAYVKNGSGFSRKPDMEIDDRNDILVFGSKDLAVAGVYAGFKLFDGETVLGNFERLLTGLRPVCDKFPRVLVGGDFNADPSRIGPKSKLLETWQTDYGMEQLVNSNTRVRQVAGNLQQSMIDLVYEKDLENVLIDVLYSEVSDHGVIAARYPAPPKPPVMFKKRVIVDWRNFKPESMCQSLRCSLGGLSVNDSPDIFDRDLSMAILSSMNDVIPKRVVHVRRDTDVVNYHIEAVKKKRDRLLKKARKTNDPKTMSRVKDLNKVIKTVVVRERDRLIKNKMKNSSSSTFWKTVNGLLGRASNSEIRISDGNGFLSDEDAAQSFADFFQSKVEGLIGQNPIEDAVVDSNYVEIAAFTVEEIRKALESFKPKKSAGPDEIPLIVFKTCFDPLEEHVHCLFRQITTLGKIPRMWKLARLKPILKKGDSSCVENYRPISNLNTISKLFERCLLNRISHINTDGPNQHGFKTSHSTTTATIELQNYLATHLDLNRHCLIYSVDLSAAFDLIRPGIFTKKAREVIKDSGIVSLMYDFITDRKAYVEIDASSSSVFKLAVGCPQGSTLGPKVFNIYCNDLHDHVDGFLVSYADDSYVVVVDEDIDKLKKKAENTMNKHLEWLRENGMVCNVAKTEMMIMNQEESTSITVNNRIIHTQSQMNVLGITFDSKMNWERQVSRTISKTNRMLHGLRKIRRFLGSDQAKQVVTSFYYSSLYYGLEVWYHRHLSFHLKQKVRSAHYRALRVIHGSKTRSELDAIGLRATPDELSDYSIGKLLAKMLITSEPARLKRETLQNAYSLRRQPERLFFFDGSKRKIGRQCIKNRLNCISKQMKFNWLSASVGSLRSSLKKCFFSYIKMK